MLGVTTFFIKMHKNGKSFQSTLPMLGVTMVTWPFFPIGRYFNPHSQCWEWHASSNNGKILFIISIHTPNAGSDAQTLKYFFVCSNFNPHSQCWEWLRVKKIIKNHQGFQSTLPMLGVTTLLSYYSAYENKFQSTLPMLGVTKKLWNKGVKT